MGCVPLSRSVIHTEFEEKGKKSSEWHYYISSRKFTALELLHHARMEWAVETMHCLLNPASLRALLFEN